MRREPQKQRAAILMLLAMLAACILISWTWLDAKEKEIQALEKMNFELQLNSDKLQEINDTYYDRIVTQQSQIEDLKGTVKRILTLSSETADQVQSVVMSETRGSSLQDAIAVTQTILDRSTQWDQSGSDVIFASGQYAKPYNGPTSEKVKLAFELVYIDGYRIFEEPTTHFYNQEVCNPAWADTKTCRGVIRKHAYYY